jgi:hypothetical protein
MWLSVDPALGEYLPEAPVDDEARERNGNLPGMGGVYNTVNLHLYHYAGNNPVKYTDPDGRTAKWFARLMIRIGVAIFGGAATKAIYRYSLNGKLQNVNASPQNDTYGLSSALKKEMSNITVNEKSLTTKIGETLNNGDTKGGGDGKVSGKGSGGYGSDMSLVIGKANFEWNMLGENENGDVNVDVKVTDKFNFGKGGRGPMGEFLTSLGRDGRLKEADITVTFTLVFRKNSEGKYEQSE